MRTHRAQDQAIGLLIILMGVLFALAMFCGLENLSGYHGSVYQALHPDSFPGDRFMSPTRPTMLSMYYLIVKAIGEPWLDDRLTMVVYAGLVVLALFGVDKTAQLLGARRAGERVAMLSLMLLGHKILDNQGWLLGHADFNATQLSSPLIIWLLFHGLAGPRSRVAIPLMVLILALSIKNGWFPCLVVLALLGKERLHRRGQLIAAAAAAALMMAGWGAYALFLRSPDDVRLFNFLHHELDNAEANPFLNPWYANLIFVVLCVAGWLAKGLPGAVSARVRVVARAGLALWLLGGLYFTWAPDALKIPHLVPFDVTRALWWSQYVMYLVLGVALLKQVQRATSAASLGAAWGLLMGLYFLHWTFQVKLALVVAAVTVGMAGWALWTRRDRGWRAGFDAPAQLQIAAVAMCVGVVSLYGVGTVTRRWDALVFLARHGIVGDNGGAVWLDVNPYIREHTPASATVLALAERNALGQDLGLRFEGSLRNRTGRSMPLGSIAAFYLDYPNILWCQAQRQEAHYLVEAWEREDLPAVSTRLAHLGSPEYLVVPIERSAWLGNRPDFAYQFEVARGAYWIFRRKAGTVWAHTPHVL